MRVLILGGDGYLGWPTAMNMSRRGYDVTVVDNYFRRWACHELDAEPLVPVPNMQARAALWQEKTGLLIRVAVGDITDYSFLATVFSGKDFGAEGPGGPPEAVVHYAEQPSAPYSMINREKAAFTVRNNLIGTLNLIHAVKEFNPDCHIVKLGTMGVYGTPNIDIEEGYLEVEHKGRRHTFLYPKAPGSLYHLTKAQDGDLLYFYCRMWDIRVTDLNQGPVYGIRTDESGDEEQLLGIFNYDDVFGTVLNRFVTQAVAGFPLTVFGRGGQIRGYLDIRDTLACVGLAVDHPAEKGQYRVFNQFVETFTVNQLAERVRAAGRKVGLSVQIKSITNPRKELEEHYYHPANTSLLDLGLRPHYLSEDYLAGMIEFVLKYRHRIDRDRILPRVTWV
ncbi:MAG: NAD-dependent epimerase/dehydratase family protein [Thermodesulfobacteriota bacterium]